MNKFEKEMVDLNTVTNILLFGITFILFMILSTLMAILIDNEFFGIIMIIILFLYFMELLPRTPTFKEMILREKKK